MFSHFPRRRKVTPNVIGIGIPGAFAKGMDSPVMTNEFHLVVDALQAMLSASTESQV
jgi:hypothetical protein